MTDAYFKEKCPGIEVVTTLESGDDQQKAFANAQNLLQTYPDLAGIIDDGQEAPHCFARSHFGAAARDCWSWKTATDTISRKRSRPTVWI